MHDDPDVDDALESFIVEADLAGRFLERYFLGPSWRFWRPRLDYSRNSLALVTQILERTLAGEVSLSMDEVARRVMQYVGETIQLHVRAFWQRVDGRITLRVHHADGHTVAMDLAALCAETLLGLHARDVRSQQLLQAAFDEALRAGTPPVRV